MIRFHLMAFLAPICVGITLVGCGGAEDKAGTGAGKTEITGTVRIDGSSTVFPITEAVAEEFQAVHPKIRVTVGLSGTGGGFKKFDVGETDINNASRPITQAEADTAKSNGISFIEVPIAYDGISIVVNPKNDWAESMTVAELKRTWEPGSTIKKWNEIRPEWPDRDIKLYGAGHDSGTFDYFTEAIMGKSRACRPDYTASEDDNTLVQGVAGDIDALGFFGFAYYESNQNKLKLVAIDNGKGPISPSVETINNGTYTPLSRPVFIYITETASNRPEVDAFVNFYLDEAPVLTLEVGYIPLPDSIYTAAKNRFAKRVTGSIFEGLHPVGLDIEELLKAEK